MKHSLAARPLPAGALLGGYRAEQQSGVPLSNEPTANETAMQTIQRLNAFGSVFFSVQQRLKINPAHFASKWAKAG